MSTPLTSAINVLTAYANGITGKSDTTLSDAVHSLADGYGGGSTKLVKGTFLGDGTHNYVGIACDFNPDVVIITGKLSGEASNVGPVIICLVRDMLAISTYDNSATGTNYINYPQLSVTGLNETTYTTRSSYATYNNGVLTVNNDTGSTQFGRFANGITYTYILAKYS